MCKYADSRHHSGPVLLRPRRGASTPVATVTTAAVLLAVVARRLPVAARGTTLPAGTRSAIAIETTTAIVVTEAIGLGALTIGMLYLPLTPVLLS